MRDFNGRHGNMVFCRKQRAVGLGVGGGGQWHGLGEGSGWRRGVGEGGLGLECAVPSLIVLRCIFDDGWQTASEISCAVKTTIGFYVVTCKMSIYYFKHLRNAV